MAIPLALGIFSGSGTRKVVRSPWYEVCVPVPISGTPLNQYFTTLEPQVPPRKATASSIPHSLANPVSLFVHSSFFKTDTEYYGLYSYGICLPHCR
jgi:hypothetical protein